MRAARNLGRFTIHWYNHYHHHSALEGHVPSAVHDGSWRQVHAHRQAALNTLAARHPHRYRNPPRLRTPHASVTLNREKPDQRLQPA